MTPLFLCLTLALAVDGGTSTAREAAPTRIASDDAVATLDGDPIQRLDYERWLLGERGELMATRYGRIHAIRERARELGVALAPGAVREVIASEVEARIENAFDGDRDAWAAELAISRTTPEGYFQSRASEVEIDLLGKLIANVGRVVPEAKIERDFEIAYGPSGVRARVRAIQIAVELVTPEGGWPIEERRAALERAQAEARARLDTLLAGVRTGTTSFSTVAAEHSDHESAANGGMLEGFFEPTGWPARVTEAIVATPAGELTPAIAARGGVWVFQVVSRLETDYEDVREELEQDLIDRGPENDEVLDALQPLFASLAATPGEQLITGTNEDPAGLALTVNDAPIDVATYGGWLRRAYGEAMLPRYAERRALDAMAIEHGIDPTPEQIEARIEENLAITIELQYSGDRAAWEASLQGNDRTLESWRREALRRGRYELIAEGLIKLDREISEEAILATWIDRYGTDGMRVDARFIAKKIDYPERLPDEPDRMYRRRLDEAARVQLDELDDLRSRIEDGVDFATLAEKHSDDRESAVLGGVPPGGFRVEDWSIQAREVLNSTAAGQLAAPFVDNEYAVLFEITGRKEVPLESVRNALVTELMAERISVVELAAFRNVLTRDIEIRTLPEMFD